MICEAAVMLGADQRVQVRWPDLLGIVQFLQVAFPIGHDHHLGLRHPPRRGCRRA